MDALTAIHAVINTLEDVEVRGSDNLHALVNSIDTLRAIVKAINDAKEGEHGRSEAESNNGAAGDN